MTSQRPEEVASVKQEKIRGTLKNFVSYRGFGFITPDDEPETEVFVYLKNLVGFEGNEYPYFPKGIPVEFVKVKDAKGWRAQEVSQPGGAKLVSVSEDPAKNYNKDVLHTGTVRFFNYKTGYGYIACDVEKIEWGGKTSESRMVMEENEEGEKEERLAASVWFPAEEVVGSIDVKKQVDVGDKVQFHVYIDEKGLGAGKVLLTAKSTKKRKKGVWSGSWPKKKKKSSIKEMAEMDTYLSGNYRGALQEYFNQRNANILTTYKSEKDPDNDDLFLTIGCTVGYKDDSIEGCGRGANKKASIKAAALDLILNLGLVSKERHMNLHTIEST